MNNFIFQNPTKLVFGKGQIAKLKTLVPIQAKVMITYGGGSIFKNGVYDQVVAALDGHKFIEFGGIEPNPEFNTLMKAVEIARAEGVDFLLAVGGGSVIDGTKFIATALKYEGDPWEFMLNESKAVDAIPLASVLTLPATGSEMNNGAVVSRRERDEKFAFHNPKAYPVFSILDPEACYSLPKKQVANGIVDTFAHTLEQYLTLAEDNRVMDRWAESLLLTLVELAPSLMSDTLDYGDYANYMLTATMGLNGFISMGATQDWATHMIGHELTALHGLDHGHTLSIVYPALMKVMREPKEGKLRQYAKRVWHTENIDTAIDNTERFFRSLGMKTRLSENGIGDETITTIVERMRSRGWNLGEGGIVTPDNVQKILETAK
ncbi:MAG: iron-containing alcohol dehydrogenase [Rikenellaceae bacterium]